MCVACEGVTAQVMLAAAERELILAQTDAGESVAHATRPLSAAEKRAKMRFGEIDALETAAAEKAAKLLASNAQVYIMAIIGAIFGAQESVEPAQVVDAVEQINKTQPRAVVAETAASQKAMSAILGQVYAGAAEIVIGEALRQGVKKTPKPFKPDAARFGPVAKAVALHPWTRLTSKLQADMLEPRTLAQPAIARADVQKNLEAIPLDGATDLARQSVHTAHGAGRVEAAETMAPEEIYSSELMDGATCEACEKVDGKDYDTMEEAKTEYESGGYGACKGGARCRGTLVFQYNRAGTDAPKAAPAPEPEPGAEAKPPVDPTATPWGRKVEEAKKALPEDLTKLGYRTETPDFNAAVSEEKQRIVEQFGADLPALKKRAAEISEKLSDWDELNQYVISYIPSKWPDAAKPLVKKLGFGRQGPKTVAPLLRDGRRDLWEMNMDASSRVSQFESQLKDVEAYVKRYKMKPRKIDDVLPDGDLGDETAKALDAVLDAGKTFDDELQGRVEKRIGKSPLTAKNDLHEKRRKLMTERATTGDDALFEKLGEDLKKLQAEIDATAAKVKPYRIARAKALREEAFAMLADVRGMGGGRRSTYTRGAGWNAEIADAMETAHQLYPDDWNDKLADMFPEIELIETARGYNGGSVMALSRDAASVGRGDFGRVAVHELGHSMEHAIPGLKAMEWALHQRRSDKIRRVDGTVELKAPYDIYGGDIGAGQEIAHTDKWAHDYTGKTYRQYNPDGAGAESQWEIFQTGVESLFEGSQFFDRDGSLGDDVEYRRFILGVLSVL